MIEIMTPMKANAIDVDSMPSSTIEITFHSGLSDIGDALPVITIPVNKI